MSCASVYVYCNLYQQIDEEEFGGLWELLKEGFMTALATFLVCHDWGSLGTKGLLHGVYSL